jgi:DNA-binding NtrC family response regulator
VHGASVSIGASRIVIEPDLEDLSRQPFNGDVYRGLVGCSPAMRSMFAMLTRLEGSRVTVHVTGESGVGKELVARAIHDGSGVTGPLVTVNCGAISRELVASELFGHKRGAFTGALESRKGAFESADGGTLFLDEVGELPLDVQPMLLRALETGEVRPVGGDRVGTFSVRVISATHRDLEKEVRRGRFREDLFYRLAVIKLVVPPLRERIEDIEVLARRFASALGVDLPPPALEEIKRRPWPGNARELRNVVQAYSVLLAIPPAAARENTELDAAIGAFVDVARPYAELKEQLLDRFQHAYLEQLLARVRGNQSAAAKLSGLDRTYLGRLLARYGLARHCV